MIIFFTYLSICIANNTISLTNPTKHFFTNLSPQGWGFFTRSPTDKNIDIYLIRNQKLILLSVPNGSKANYLGFSRKSRKIGMEISIILGKVKSEKWDTITNNTSHLRIPKMKHHINAEYLHYLSKGDYLLVKKEIIPWSWRQSKYNFIPYETMHVKVN